MPPPTHSFVACVKKTGRNCTHPRYRGVSASSRKRSVYLVGRDRGSLVVRGEDARQERTTSGTRSRVRTGREERNPAAIPGCAPSSAIKCVKAKRRKDGDGPGVPALMPLQRQQPFPSTA
ncbi:hypothetical protein HPB50_022212 [Hyalomma asiaticum]|uniref:Uncharacterized protein n=1 Tax=Hyalomma asiaticum TaxID=266040 RepID=A0ACB7SD83_HYAAI|nr:hypothetical protein HPB50_022212 [Hyalomma asiaticum]